MKVLWGSIEPKNRKQIVGYVKDEKSPSGESPICKISETVPNKKGLRIRVWAHNEAGAPILVNRSVDWGWDKCKDWVQEFMNERATAEVLDA